MSFKEEIFEFYVNSYYLGGSSYGVQAASEYYFDKDVGDLTLEEAAFLAGINHAPNTYNPFKEQNHDKIMEKIDKRTKTVLAKMLELGKVSQEEYDAAIMKYLKNCV